ncbi:MAG: hypothetical protein HC788_00895 [Sphingopyxis sp.]|nr:hypothetical protein [Sphingopyxis sp.]
MVARLNHIMLYSRDKVARGALAAARFGIPLLFAKVGVEGSNPFARSILSHKNKDVVESEHRVHGLQEAEISNVSSL